MGCAISANHKPYPQQKFNELNVKSYDSSFDDVFTYYETDLNVLRNIELLDFKQLLFNYTATNEEKDEAKNKVSLEYDYEISDVMYRMFLEKKIFNHFEVEPILAKNESEAARAKALFSKMFDFYYKNYKFYLKKICREKGEHHHDKIKKLVLLSLGFVFCNTSSNYERALFFFNLFCDENREIKNSIDLETFLFFIILTPSNILLLAISTMTEEYEDLKLDEEKKIKIYSCFEVKDSKRILDITLEKLFKGKESINFNDFLSSVSEIDWIFSTNGIRHILEKNNDAQEE